jgi:hypothetical protein
MLPCGTWGVRCVAAGLPCGMWRGEVDLSELATWHIGGAHMSGQYGGGAHLAEVDQWGADTWH